MDFQPSRPQQSPIQTICWNRSCIEYVQKGMYEKKCETLHYMRGHPPSGRILCYDSTLPTPYCYRGRFVHQHNQWAVEPHSYRSRIADLYRVRTDAKNPTRGNFTDVKGWSGATIANPTNESSPPRDTSNSLTAHPFQGWLVLWIIWANTKETFSKFIGETCVEGPGVPTLGCWDGLMALGVHNTKIGAAGFFRDGAI